MIELITVLYANCVFLAWTPSTGDVTHYDLYHNMIYEQTVTEPTAHICNVWGYQQPSIDSGGPPYATHSYWVVGLNATESSENSNELLIQWHWNFDSDENGIVDFSDFGRFGQAFGECNDGVKQVPCG
jgi:hypothetical protein